MSASAASTVSRSEGFAGLDVLDGFAARTGRGAFAACPFAPFGLAATGPLAAVFFFTGDRFGRPAVAVAGLRAGAGGRLVLARFAVMLTSWS
jgi:hypothetical protein